MSAPEPALLSQAALMSRPCPCPACRGRGTVPALKCARCAFAERVSRNTGLPHAAAAWHEAKDVHEGVFPCGHVFTGEGVELIPWAIVRGQSDCSTCGGEGEVPVWKSPSAWAKQDARDARQKKQAASDAAKVLFESGPALGYSIKAWRQMLRFLRPVCQAHCRRTGKPCRNPVVLGAVRCGLHGGKSRGPVTAEGRARIADSNRRRQKAASAPLSD